MALTSTSEVVEIDPSRLYTRLNRILGQGSTKKVYLGFDGEDGKEIAWSLTQLAEKDLKSDDYHEALCAEAHLLKALEYDNTHMITGLFTSGRMSQYIRNHFNLVDDKFIKKWARQIIQAGISHLHSGNIGSKVRDLEVNGFIMFLALASVRTTASVSSTSAASSNQSRTEVKESRCDRIKRRRSEEKSLETIKHKAELYEFDHLNINLRFYRSIEDDNHTQLYKIPRKKILSKVTFKYQLETKRVLFEETEFDHTLTEVDYNNPCAGYFLYLWDSGNFLYLEDYWPQILRRLTDVDAYLR